MRSRNLVITLAIIWLIVFAACAGMAYYRTTAHRVKNETAVPGTVSGKISGDPETQGRGSSLSDEKERTTGQISSMSIMFCREYRQSGSAAAPMEGGYYHDT